MKFTTEKESLDYVESFLSRMGFTEIHQTQSDNQFEHYDISAMFKGKKCFFELKRRHFNHDKYNDVIVEDYKYFHLLDDIVNGVADKCYIVTLFDDILVINNIEDSMPVFINRESAKSTEFENKNIVEKKFATFKIGKVFQYVS